MISRIIEELSEFVRYLTFSWHCLVALVVYFKETGDTFYILYKLIVVFHKSFPAVV